MSRLSKQIQLRYEGFLQTPSLWTKEALYTLDPFEINPASSIFNLPLDEKLRLGKYVERFVSFQLQQEASINIIAENIQIQKDKITLGEVDCLLYKEEQPIHLEVVYKFYLYDPNVGSTEIDHFIGPNRKDSLLEKLNKLKDKQLPLVFKEEAKSYLDRYKMDASKLKQQVYFKAQLFVPYAAQEIRLDRLNESCITGFYLNPTELQLFTDCKFYLPEKKDWLLAPSTQVAWLSFPDFHQKMTVFLADKISKLCWLKKPNGTIHKIFVVWW
ncbi:hypothetical protein GCM10011416_16300 [Polaribacter pacificus]|uniref:DUF1853 domain-containing protein n=1 Tax=Polaribacter pacificus TaxID=1775173 RepID=A0A917I023_9FLAO|nr:DUF1853 family protein [Polaribacter pacificus]GGG98807.1 hypothetical protein GCM10011416_16300 [Polaribacter pacificus]